MRLSGLQLHRPRNVGHGCVELALVLAGRGQKNERVDVDRIDFEDLLIMPFGIGQLSGLMMPRALASNSETVGTEASTRKPWLARPNLSTGGNR